MPDPRIWWRRTVRLVLVALAIWFVFGFAIHGFVDALNTIVVADFPLGFWMAAQGSLIVFVVLVFWFCARQERIDRDAGLSEPESQREEIAP